MDWGWRCRIHSEQRAFSANPATSNSTGARFQIGKRKQSLYLLVFSVVFSEKRLVIFIYVPHFFRVWWLISFAFCQLKKLQIFQWSPGTHDTHMSHPRQDAWWLKRRPRRFQWSSAPQTPSVRDLRNGWKWTRCLRRDPWIVCDTVHWCLSHRHNTTVSTIESNLSLNYVAAERLNILLGLQVFLNLRFGHRRRLCETWHRRASLRIYWGGSPSQQPFISKIKLSPLQQAHGSWHVMSFSHCVHVQCTYANSTWLWHTMCVYIATSSRGMRTDLSAVGYPTIVFSTWCIGISGSVHSFKWGYHFNYGQQIIQKWAEPDLLLADELAQVCSLSRSEG